MATARLTSRMRVLFDGHVPARASAQPSASRRAGHDGCRQADVSGCSSTENSASASQSFAIRRSWRAKSRGHGKRRQLPSDCSRAFRTYTGSHVAAFVPRQVARDHELTETVCAGARGRPIAVAAWVVQLHRHDVSQGMERSGMPGRDREQQARAIGSVTHSSRPVPCVDRQWRQ